MQPIALHSLPLSTSGEGSGPQKSNDGKKKNSDHIVEVKQEEEKEEEEEELEGGAPWMRIGLEIGEAARSPVIKQGKHQSLLTVSQLRELQEQALIFKYIAAGIPVPHTLVLPIWKSVAASSFGSVNGGIYRQFPSFVGYSPQGFHYRNLMDPEPGRCRRTDGKKWRCSKNALVGEKYCERHMHRGRQRSRKHVEASQTTTSLKTPPNSSRKQTNHSIPTPVVPQPIALPSNNVSTNRITRCTTCGNVDFNIGGTTMVSSSVSAQKSTGITMATSAITCTSPRSNTTTMIPNSVKMETTTSSAATYRNSKNSSININCQDIDNGNSTYNNPVSSRNIIDRSSINRSIKNSQGFNFSPKSVLQVQGSTGSSLYRSYELEPGRCRRTDGKKWRCRRDVVTNGKYCEIHLHRGVKKHAQASQQAFSTSTPKLSPITEPKPAVIMPNEANGTYLNTNLSMSVPANSQRMTNHDTSGMTSSSDATISDTVTADCENSNFSH